MQHRVLHSITVLTMSQWLEITTFHFSPCQKFLQIHRIPDLRTSQHNAQKTLSLHVLLPEACRITPNPSINTKSIQWNQCRVWVLDRSWSERGRAPVPHTSTITSIIHLAQYLIPITTVTNFLWLLSLVLGDGATWHVSGPVTPEADIDHSI